MLTSLALVFLLGLLLGFIFKKLKLPSILGMLFTGVILGPYVLNLLDHSLLSISADLRQIALVIILTRAGLALDIKDLKKVGRPALLLCFIPACLEIVGIVLLAPRLNISLLEAAILGTAVAAISPAVIVPRMLHLMKRGYGIARSIPQMIMAGASVEDVFVIVLFTSFTGLASGGQLSPGNFFKVPISIAMGLLAGVLCGLLLSQLFRRIHIRDSAKVLILLSASFLLIALETALRPILPLSGLLAIMAMAATLLKTYESLASRLSIKFSKLWVAAEVLVFVLVGATVDVRYAVHAGAATILVILGALLFRMAGVFLCLIKTSLGRKERLFCMLSSLPKATVQAAIGAVPLAMGLSCGQIVLTASVLAIIITAPLGALGIDLSYKKLLTQDSEKPE